MPRYHWPSRCYRNHSLAQTGDWMRLPDAGKQARLGRHPVYFKHFATSHGELDVDRALQQEVKNVAIMVADAIKTLRAGCLNPVPTPWPK